MNTLTVINYISQTGLFEVLAIKAKYNYILLRIQLQSSRVATKSFAASVTDVSQLQYSKYKSWIVLRQDQDMTELYLILYLSDKGETYLIFIEESRPNCMEKHI